MRVVGLYPSFLIHRRNQDHLYWRALEALYRNLGHEFSIIEDRWYNTRCCGYYLLLRQLKKTGASPRMYHSVARRQMEMPIPLRFARMGQVFHGPGAIPRNVSGWIIREGEFYEFDRPARAAAVFRLTENHLRQVARFAVRTELSRRFFCEQYPEVYHEKAVPVPYYMPYLQSWESREPRKPHPAEGIRLIFVGNQARRKGLDVFVQLVRELKAVAQVPVTAVVVSNFQDGEDFDLSGVDVRRGLNGGEVQALMEQAHYLVLPTRADSHPKVMYEACATGCSLVFSTIRPLKDIWDGAGHAVDATQDGALSKLARVLAAAGGDLALGAANRRRFLSEFSPSVAALKYARLLPGSASGES